MRSKAKRRKFGKQGPMPHPVKRLRNVKSDDIRFPKVPQRGRPYMGEIGEKITSRSRFTETILMIRKKGKRF